MFGTPTGTVSRRTGNAKTARTPPASAGVAKRGHLRRARGSARSVTATGEPVAVTDLALPRARLRWPRFATPALAGGVRAVFAFPVRLDTVPVGVPNIYRATAGTL